MDRTAYYQVRVKVFLSDSIIHLKIPQCVSIARFSGNNCEKDTTASYVGLPGGRIEAYIHPSRDVRLEAVQLENVPRYIGLEIDMDDSCKCRWRRIKCESGPDGNNVTKSLQMWRRQKPAAAPQLSSFLN